MLCVREPRPCGLLAALGGDAGTAAKALEFLQDLAGPGEGPPVTPRGDDPCEPQSICKPTFATNKLEHCKPDKMFNFSDGLCQIGTPPTLSHRNNEYGRNPHRVAWTGGKNSAATAEKMKPCILEKILFLLFLSQISLLKGEYLFGTFGPPKSDLLGGDTLLVLLSGFFGGVLFGGGYSVCVERNPCVSRGIG